MHPRLLIGMAFLRLFPFVRDTVGHGHKIGYSAAFNLSRGRSRISTRAASLHSSSSSSNENSHSRITDSLSSILRCNEVSSDELNEDCLLALSRCPDPVAEIALKAYVKQKIRRKTIGMDKISDPSKYIMAVMRNTMTESTISSPLTTNFNAIKKNGQEHGIIEEDSDLVQKPHTSKKRMLTSKFATETTKTTEVPANHHLVRRQTLGAHDAHEMKGVVTADPERVTMDYVEKCLSCIAKLERPIIQLSGVGPKTEAAFHSLGIFTLRDVLWHFPRYFIDRSRIQKSIQNVVEGNVGTFLLSVGEPKYNTVTCTDEDGNEVDVTYFYGRSRQGMVAASAAIRKLCNKDSNVMIVSGRITNTEAGRLVIFNPDIVVSPDKADSLGIEAVYSLASGLSQQKVSTAVKEALVVACELLKLLPESLPEELLAKLHWPKLVDALMLSHKPTSMEETGFNSTVRQRIVFEELSMQQTRLALTRWNLKHFGVTPNLQRKRVHSCWKDSPLVSAAVSALPFNLNSYQMKCLDELWNDAIVGNDEKMLRLLQGDVGSGKTVLAYLLGLGCIEACQGGGQIVALMCPTQLLASQHVQTISEYACRMQGSSDWNIRVELLTGNVVGKTREDLLARLEASTDKSAVFLVGTHALTTPDIVSRLMQLSSGLALAIVDEEQRFGVRQRLALTKCAAHSLFMSATPIPRSISLKRSAMVDFTVLESDPRIVTTTITSSEKLESVLSVLGTKIQEGSKCFWVLPRIVRSEDSDGGDGDSISRPTVIERYSMLKNRFGEERVCHVHGKMAEHEREEQIARFADPSSGAAILVGTTVIEVGIDIPDTNILIVEDADRFGLSQLHQLRGRIGRAGSRLDLKCNCILLSNVTAASQSPASLTRLQILQKTNKGEEIADADFYLRGPGDMLGQLQSGIKKGRVVDLVNHWDLLDAATQFGRRFIELPSEQLRQVSAMEDASHTIMTWLAERNAAISHLNTNAASKQGLALRIMMALFAEGRSVEGNSIEVINTLQNLDASKGEQTHDDETIHAKIVEAFFNERNDLKSLNPIPNDLGTQSNMEDPVRPPKPYLAALNTQLSMEKRLNLIDDDVMFLVLDCETTGLDDKTCHIIQLAAKVLGSDDENDLFSEYILPPIDHIPVQIEELTGITDEFLRNGGFDHALGKEKGTARDFRQVYHDLQLFCNERANGRSIVLIAHNAKFDVRMINGELRRWRFSDGGSPMLGETFTCYLDTLQLFRDRKWWRTNQGSEHCLPRPSSFSLSELHSHVLNESIANSHNAVGDVKALERLLLSRPFVGWKTSANELQVPFVRVEV